MSRAVRAGLLAWVAPQRARAACRAGGQLLTTPRGSPFTGMIWRPSGFGVLGSGWGTRHENWQARNCEYCNAVTLWCYNTLGDFLKKWKPFSKQPRGFLCCSTHNGENQAWHIVLCATPSTISSESSRKNSLSGGLLGRLSVFNSCWILVDTLLLTGTPGQTRRAAAVTNICKQTMTRRHPHMQVYSNMNLYFNTRSLAHTGSNLRISTVRNRISSRKNLKGKFAHKETQSGQFFQENTIKEDFYFYTYSMRQT